MVHVPAGLLSAVIADGGSRLAIVIGAGCSVEMPTAMPLAGDLSEEACRRLVSEQVLVEGECQDPRNLSALASLVYQKTGSQAALVRQFPLDRMRTAPGNDGYKFLIALMLEGVISHALSLNFDLAPQNAAVQLRETVTVVDRINEPIPMAKTVVHLHGSVNGSSEELILRVEALTDDWREKWQEVVTRQILAAPNVLFVGLGSAAPVLSETVAMIANALGHQKNFYQADLGAHENNYFAQQLQIAADHYIKGPWSEVMGALAKHLAREQIHTLKMSGKALFRDNNVAAEDIARFEAMTTHLADLSLLGLGRLRANIRLSRGSLYQPRSVPDEEWLSGPLLTLAAIAEADGLTVHPTPAGTFLFKRTGRIVSNVLLVSGRGSRKLSALDPSITALSKELSETTGSGPDLVLVGGTLPEPLAASVVPGDIVDGDEIEDIVTGPIKPRVLVIDGENVVNEAREFLNAA